MSRPLAALLGFASVLPVVYLVFFVWHVASLEPDAAAGPAFESLLGLHLAAAGLVLALTTAYLVMLYRSALVPQDRRLLWAIVLCLANVFALPAFWYFLLWRPAGERID